MANPNSDKTTSESRDSTATKKIDETTPAIHLNNLKWLSVWLDEQSLNDQAASVRWLIERVTIEELNNAWKREV